MAYLVCMVNAKNVCEETSTRNLNQESCHLDCVSTCLVTVGVGLGRLSDKLAGK